MTSVARSDARISSPTEGRLRGHRVATGEPRRRCFDGARRPCGMWRRGTGAPLCRWVESNGPVLGIAVGSASSSGGKTIGPPAASCRISVGRRSSSFPYASTRPAERRIRSRTSAYIAGDSRSSSRRTSEKSAPAGKRTDCSSLRGEGPSDLHRTTKTSLRSPRVMRTAPSAPRLTRRSRGAFADRSRSTHRIDRAEGMAWRWRGRRPPRRQPSGSTERACAGHAAERPSGRSFVRLASRFACCVCTSHLLGSPGIGDSYVSAHSCAPAYKQNRRP
jgi:hypothetical protein